MATIDEVFASMPDTSAGVTHELLIIDPDTRQIYVPEIEKVFGVTEDGNAERKYFQAPRYVGDNLDLSACDIQVLYQNASGTEDGRDGYLVDDITTNGNNVYFSWRLSPKVTLYQGAVSFLVAAYQNGAIAWHTTLATGDVLEGMSYNGVVVQTAMQDVIAQLLDLVTSQSAAVEAAGAAQIEAVETAAADATSAAKTEIDAKAANVLATIPADYTAMEARVAAMEKLKAAAIICEAEGETILLHDSADNYLPSLRIFGKTTQAKTTGAQLVRLTLTGAITAAGLTASPTADGNLEINGTHTGTAMWVEFGKATLEAGKTYTLSCPADFALHMWDLTNNKEHRTKKLAAESITIEATETIEVAIVLNDAVTGKTYSHVTVDALLAEGATVLPWEPYTGGQASPSPDYPQELQSIPAPAVTVCGKNRCASQEYGTIFPCRLEANVVYTASVGNPSEDAMCLLVYDQNQERLQSVKCTSDIRGRRYANITPAQDVYFAMWAWANVTTVESGQIEIGPTATEYEPYTGQTLQLANDLPGIPVSSGGNYTDAAGQQWLCDEVDLARGVYVQRIAQHILDGSHHVEQVATGGDKSRFDFSGVSGTPGGAVLCDSLSASISQSANTVQIHGGTGKLIIFTNAAATPDELRAYLSANPWELLLQIEPQETPLTEAELAAFAAMRSYKPNTTLLNDAGAHMAAEYVADTKLYIDNALAALIAAGNE